MYILFFYFFLYNMIYAVIRKSHVKHRIRSNLESGSGLENQDGGRVGMW